MRKVKVITAEEAVAYVKDGDTLATSGFVGNVVPEVLLRALEQRYLAANSPKNITYVYSAGQGIGKADASFAADHIAYPGMTKRVIAGHYNLAPKLGKLIMNNEIECYCFPQGVITHLMRDIAAHKPGTITHVGLGTFVDPRFEGGKINAKTTENLVEVIDILGQEKLIYKAFPIQVAFLKGTSADENGNVTLEKEVCITDVTAIAQAVKNSGGKVFVQVERIVGKGTLNPKLVRIPGIYVDAVVVSETKDNLQMLSRPDYNPALSGEIYVSIDPSESPIPLDTKKIIARRAAMELRENTIVNLGIGAPEFVSAVAKEEGIGDYMTLTVESGPIGGFPQGGTAFGASMNADAIINEQEQFDFYQGGGIDLAYLGNAQTDEKGNINVSKFGTRLAGCGGFIDITQNSKKVFFCGTFTAGGLEVKTGDGKLAIVKEGKEKKFIKKVDQVTFSGEYAQKIKQPVMYITERAVFELRSDGLYLTEVAPGVDTQKDIFDQMEFKPKVDGPKLMDARIFTSKPMGLKK
jgi:propionate CoA-transferase